MKRSIALLISCLMVAGLFTGCGNTATGGETTTAPTTGAGDTVTAESAGTLLVNAGAIMTVTYDAEGSAVKVEGVNDNGKELVEEYESYLGSACAQVISRFIKDSVMRDYMFDINHVVVKVNKGSVLPGTKFLVNIETSAKDALHTAYSTAALVMITEENLDHNGDIDLVAAKVLVEKFLQVETLDSIDGTDAPIDGLYAFTVRYGDWEEQVLVNAVTGGVAQGTLDETEEDFEESEEEETTEDQEADTNA